jgi:hypothetical protein
MERDPIQSLLDRLSATLYKAGQEGSKHHLDYEEIIRDLAEQRLAKVAQYGEDRYDSNEGEDFDLWMSFSDVYRKFIRLKQLTRLALKGDEAAKIALVDAYKDIANYGIMGVQITNKHYGKTISDKS